MIILYVVLDSKENVFIFWIDINLIENILSYLFLYFIYVYCVI